MPKQQKAHSDLPAPSERQQRHWAAMRELDAKGRRIEELSQQIRYVYDMLMHDGGNPWISRVARDPENPFLDEKTRQQLAKEKERAQPQRAPTVFESRCR